jgi:hypothetical protein
VLQAVQMLLHPAVHPAASALQTVSSRTTVQLHQRMSTPRLHRRTSRQLLLLVVLLLAGIMCSSSSSSTELGCCATAQSTASTTPLHSLKQASPCKGWNLLHALQCQVLLLLLQAGRTLAAAAVKEAQPALLVGMPIRRQVLVQAQRQVIWRSSSGSGRQWRGKL